MLNLIIGFVVIVALIRKKVNYGLSMILGGFTMGLISQFDFSDFSYVLQKSTLDVSTLRLICIVSMINILGYLLREFGQVDNALKSLQFLGSKNILALIPAVFGLMPMPGGALVSAPIIDPDASKVGLSQEYKTFINFWFRHVIFFIFPLNAGMILASELSGMSVYRIILYQLPFFFLALFLGVWRMRHIKNTPEDTSVNLQFLWYLFPIILVIALNMLVGVDFVYGLILAIVFVFIQNKSKNIKMIAEGFSYNLVIAVFGIMFFRFTVERTGVIEDFLIEGIPIELLFVFVPWFIGLATGLNMPAIGLSLPLLLPFTTSPFHVSILFVSCVLGYLSSPLHLCLIVTTEYFHANLGKVYKLFLPLLVLLLFFNLLYAFVA
jgi:hypothetical protein